MAEGILGLGNEGVQLAALEIEDLSPLGPVLRDVEDKGVSVLPIFSHRTTACRPAGHRWGSRSPPPR
jgi:hypothetical protein